jgi:hypothetical protein
MERTPFRSGLEAARAILAPALIVQATMFAVVIGYYFHPPTRAALQTLAEIKAATGYGFSFVSSMLAGALLPELLSVCVFQRGKFRASNFANLRFTMIYWGLDGVIVDAFYRVQSLMFGDHANLGTVTAKVCVDQFVATPLFFTPVTLAFYEWRRHGYATSGFAEAFTWKYYRERGIPTVVTNWALWIPVVSAVYSLPPLLQIPLFALALTIWVMLFTYMNAGRTDPTLAIPPENRQGARTRTS